MQSNPFDALDVDGAITARSARLLYRNVNEVPITQKHYHLLYVLLMAIYVKLP